MITGVSSDLFILEKAPSLQMGSLAQRMVAGSGIVGVGALT